MKGADSILVLGHGGLLGRAVVESCGGNCWVVEGGRRAFDLSRPALKGCPNSFEHDRPDAGGADQSLDWLLKRLPEAGDALEFLHEGLDLLRTFICRRKPGVVINCAGYTDVDKAEEEPELARAVNAAGAEAVAAACAEAGSHLVHISTDYVFDGFTDRPYVENDEPSPQTAYGRSKLEGERLVTRAHPGALIVRSAWLFGPGRAGFVDKVVARATEGDHVDVVTTEVGSPTYSRDLAEAVMTLARKRVQGVLHVVNTGRASRLELARQALRLAGLDPDLARPLEGPLPGRPACRPQFSVLDTRRYAKITGGAMPTWLDALARYMAEAKEEMT